MQEVASATLPLVDILNGRVEERLGDWFLLEMKHGVFDKKKQARLVPQAYAAFYLMKANISDKVPIEQQLLNLEAHFYRVNVSHPLIGPSASGSQWLNTPHHPSRAIHWRVDRQNVGCFDRL